MHSYILESSTTGCILSYFASNLLHSKDIISVLHNKFDAMYDSIETKRGKDFYAEFVNNLEK
jgi:hypothetical protein